jgi:hypothetical protein
VCISNKWRASSKLTEAKPYLTFALLCFALLHNLIDTCCSGGGGGYGAPVRNLLCYILKLYPRAWSNFINLKLTLLHYSSWDSFFDLSPYERN